MRPKRYFAGDLRSAVLKVRQELGPNAVILAHNKLQSGVEVTAVLSGKAAANSENVWEPDLDEETLGIRNVRESYEDSVKENIKYYSATENNGSVAVSQVVDGDVTTRNKGSHNVDPVKAGDSLMRDKTGNTLKDNKNPVQRRKPKIKPGDQIEYDFEAEMNSILHDHHEVTASNQQSVESHVVENKTQEKLPEKPKKQSAKRKRSQSKVHTALSKLKISKKEQQTLIKSDVEVSPEKTLPPILNKSLDYDQMIESIELQIGEHAFGESSRTNPVRARLIRQLMKLDISPVIIQRVVDMLVSDKVKQKMLLPQALAVIANQIPIYKEDITSIGGTIALFGATGVGKTTTIAKLAARYALKHGSEKVALITTDNNRVAATEQLRTFSNILGLPLRIARNDIEVLNALNTFSDKEFVLIDTAGMSPEEIKASKFYDLFSGGITQIKKFQVLPATMHRTALEKITFAYSDFKMHGSIITKVDETASLGAAISVAIQNHLPVAYYGNGQNVPDDFHLARAHILMSHVADIAMEFKDQETEELNGNIKSGILNNVSF